MGSRIESPEKRAYMRGARDSLRGVVVGDNPYKENDERFWRWMEGWVRAAMLQRGMTTADVPTESGVDLNAVVRPEAG